MTVLKPSPWTDALVRLNACHDAVEWCRTQPSLEVAWAKCERADWMLWLVGLLSGEPWGEGRKRLVLCATDCAETAIRYVTDEWLEGIALSCLQTARAWSHGEATREDVMEARREARQEVWDAAVSAAASAVFVVFAACAACAAFAAADDAAAAGMRALSEMADIVRAYYPEPPRLP